MSPRRCPPRQHVGPIEVRRRDAARVQEQCAHCLRPVGRPMPIQELLPEAQRNLPRWLTRRPGDGRGNSRRRALKTFYQTKAWAEQRQRVIDRDGGICQGEDCGEPAVTAHHQSYRPLLAEVPDEELVASCLRCNTHERQARIARGVLG